MKKYSDICHEINVDNPEQKLLKANTKFICKLMREKQVEQILNFLIINLRIGTKIYMVDPQKESSKSALIRHIKLYNALPLNLKTMNQARLKRKLLKNKVSFKE